MSAVTGSVEGIRERYVRGGLCGGLTPGTAPALVIVDLQYGFTDAQYGPGFDLDDEVEATGVLLAAARRAAVPVYFTTIAFTEKELESTWLRKMPAMRDLRSGERSTRIDDRLQPCDGEDVLVKRSPSAFAGTGLADLLRADGVDSVLIAGATTSGCVRATAVDACTADLPAFVVRECVGDRERAPHDASLFDMDAKYADVIDLEAALAILGTRS